MNKTAAYYARRVYRSTFENDIEDWAEAMQKIRKDYPCRGTTKAIRKGCYVTFVYPSKEGEYEKLSGPVITSSYGEKTGKHTFIIQVSPTRKKRIQGKNLYPNVIAHAQGEESLKLRT